jgi:putative membrane protein
MSSRGVIIVLVVLALVVGLPALFALFAALLGLGMFMPWMHIGPGVVPGLGILLVIVLPLLLLLGGALLVAWLWQRDRAALAANGPRADGPRDPSYEILRQRYARGEITREQYEEMRRDLGDRPGL